MKFFFWKSRNLSYCVGTAFLAWIPITQIRPGCAGIPKYTPIHRSQIIPPQKISQTELLQNFRIDLQPRSHSLFHIFCQSNERIKSIKIILLIGLVWWNLYRNRFILIKRPNSWDDHCALNRKTFIRGIKIQMKIKISKYWYG